ncbi:MAG: DIP1984 family protein [Clostridia bacterium]|nr:DIP1984 family protein [Clostridia bacterium]
MKLATALSERAEIQRKIAGLSARLNINAKVQEGDAPDENPYELLDELNDAFKRLEELIARINRTNNETKYNGRSIADMIAKRDCLKERVKILRSFLDEASARVNRYSKTEIKINSTVEVAELRKEADDLAKELRETDELIQSLNWTTELI